MFEVDTKKLTITISKGDVLDVTFKVNGLELLEQAEIFLTIKESLEDEDALLLTQCKSIDTETNSVRVFIKSSEMCKLDAGRYYYDLVYKVDGNTRTLNYPACLIVREVVHNEYS